MWYVRLLFNTFVHFLFTFVCVFFQSFNKKLISLFSKLRFIFQLFFWSFWLNVYSLTVRLINKSFVFVLFLQFWKNIVFNFMNDTICSFIAHNYFLTTPSFTKKFCSLTKTINFMNDTICSFIVLKYFLTALSFTTNFVR